MGLMRVREFTQDDAHIFCTPDQLEEQIIDATKLILNIYKDFGFDDVVIKLSTRPETRIGTDAVWDVSEKTLADALKNNNYDFILLPGEGAFYGPKLEFHLRDAIGRQWQCGTVQLDMSLPERFDLSYIGEDGQKHRPIMLHRALFGSIERFLGILIEQHAGHLPLWLSPEPVVVVPVSEKYKDYAMDVVAELKNNGIICRGDYRDESVNYKIRDLSLSKTPIIAVVGEKEQMNKSVTLRKLGVDGQESKSLESFVTFMKDSSKMPV